MPTEPRFDFSTLPASAPMPTPDELAPVAQPQRFDFSTLDRPLGSNYSIGIPSESDTYTGRAAELDPVSRGVDKAFMGMAVDMGAAADKATGYGWRAPVKMWLQGMTYEEMVDDVEAERRELRGYLEQEGGMVEGMSQGVTEFLSYFLPAGVALNGARAGAKVASVLRVLEPGKAKMVGAAAEAEMAALFAENMAFAPDEARLSNLVETVPALRNPITRYLAAREGDVGAEAVLKQNLEAVGVGILTAPLMFAVDAAKTTGVKALKKAKEAPKKPTTSEIREEVLTGTKYVVPEEIDKDEALWLHRAKGLFGDDKKAVKSVVDEDIARLQQKVRDGGNPEEALAELQEIFMRMDPQQEVFPDTARVGIEDSVRLPVRGVRKSQAHTAFAAEEWFRKSEEAIDAKRRLTGAKILKKGHELLVDHAGGVKTKLLKEAGEAGEEAVMRFELAAGSSAKADWVFQKWRSELYSPIGGGRGSMKRQDQRTLDRVIQYRRGYEIARTRPAASPTLDGGAQLSADAFLNGLEGIKNEIGPAKYAEMTRRTNRYFDAMREQLGELHRSGLISDAEQAVLERFDYQPRQLIQRVDPIQKIKIGGEPTSVSSSGIEPLGKAGERLIETDSAFLLAQVVSRTQSRVAKNEAAKSLGKVAKEMLEGNGFIAEKRFKGSTKISYREGGEQKAFFMDEEYAKQWVHRGQIGGDMWAKFLGTDLMRTFATGINPEFALANFPRDIAYIFMTTNEYSPHLPAAIAQGAKDMSAVIGDTVMRKGRYEEYIRQGGGMSFLTHGARKHSRGQTQLLPWLKVPKMDLAWEKTRTVLGYVNESAEILTRLMVRERAIKNGATTEQATWHARRYIDFSQGGHAAKQADVFLPYLNASIQGMRGFARAAKQRPIETAYRTMQFGAAASIVWLHNELNYPEVMAQISPNEKARFWILPTGQSYQDEQGNTKHLYTRVAVEHTLMPIKSGFEALMARGVKGELPTREVVAAFANSASILGDPMSTMPPALRAVAQYMSNYDFYTKDKIWKGPDVLPGDEVKRYPNRPTAQAAVDAARTAREVAGIELSPERLERSIGAIVSRNVYTGTLNAGYAAVRNTPEYQLAQNRATEDALAQTPFLRRVLGRTHPLARADDMMTQLSQEASSDEKVFNDKIYQLATLAYNEGRTPGKGPEFQEVKALIKGAPAAIQERLANRYMRIMHSRKASEMLKGIDHYEASNPVWWLAVGGLHAKARAEVVYNAWRGTPPNQRGRLLRYALTTPGGKNREFKAEFDRLTKERGRDFP